MKNVAAAYRDFILAKIASAPSVGFEISDAEVNQRLKPHQRAVVRWMVAGGRRACFAAFGLGKTVIQLEVLRIVLARVGGRALICCPLGVKNEFVKDARAILGWSEADLPRFIRSIDECGETGIYLTNYETVREGKLDPKDFKASSLDEAAILRAFGGSKTFRTFMALFAGDDRSGVRTDGVPYRFLATATPSPNEIIELLAYAAYLGVMDVSAAKTRFFKRDSVKADHLTVHPHKVDEFWQWVSSWGLFLQKPSDLGPEYSDEGYDLPPLEVVWHEIPTEHANARADKSGQGRMFKNAALGVQEASREKRDSLHLRLAKLMELRTAEPDEHRIIWHDLEAERAAIEDAIPTAVTVYGSQPLDEREQAVSDFADGRTQELAAKPVMLGSGTNMQKHCARGVYLGIGFKFQDFIQSVHRLRRFLQTRTVRIDIIYTEAEREVRLVLERKWKQHDAMVQRMAELIRKNGLANLGKAFERSIDVDRIEVAGPNYRLIHGDAIEEAKSIESNSVGLIVTSIPFSTQYEYTPSLRDLGHTDNDEHFFAHLGFLTRELHRILQPGRDACIHVKDRITPGGINGFGFQTLNPFSDKTREHFQSHGFAFLGRITIVTDVVRENKQTNRLGWSEQCKDGSRMGVGSPEYVLVFRKAPSDPTRGYADVRVVKTKEKYSRGRWQFDAHGFQRSSGDRPITPADFEGIPHHAIFKKFKAHSLTEVYDNEQDVAIADSLNARKMLPPSFMLLQPQSNHPDVWTDVARMRTLNMIQKQKGQEQHLCPLQFDIVNRLIVQRSNPGDVVFDPFGGLMTVPYCALKLDRKGLAIELNPSYFADGHAYVKSVAQGPKMASLFDLIEAEQSPELPGATA